MSIWDLSELEECRSLVYPSMAACDVRSRYGRWGGLPRYVLEKTSDDDQRAVPAFEFAILRASTCRCFFFRRQEVLRKHKGRGRRRT
jgi:hypothetical protein